MTPRELHSNLLARAFTLRAEGNDLYVVPTPRLTPEDCAAIREHKAGLIALLAEMPSLRPDHSIHIPFASPPRYWHWAGGQSIWATLAELQAPIASWRLYAERDEGLLNGCHEARCNGMPCEIVGGWACAECGYYVEKLIS